MHPAPTRPRRYVATLVLTAAVLTPTLPPWPSAAEPVSRVPAYARPCPWEDSPRCTWDARHRGDGRGRSFIAAGRDEPVRYVTHRRAHRLVARWRAAHHRW